MSGVCAWRERVQRSGAKRPLAPPVTAMTVPLAVAATNTVVPSPSMSPRNETPGPPCPVPPDPPAGGRRSIARWGHRHGGRAAGLTGDGPLPYMAAHAAIRRRIAGA